MGQAQPNQKPGRNQAAGTRKRIADTMRRGVRKSGISSRRLDEERRIQEAVPPRGHAKAEDQQAGQRPFRPSRSDP